MSFADQLQQISGRLESSRTTIQNKFMQVDTKLQDLENDTATEFGDLRTEYDAQLQQLKDSAAAIQSELTKLASGLASAKNDLSSQTTNLNQRFVKLESGGGAAPTGPDPEITRTIAGASKPPTYSAESGNISVQDWVRKVRVYISSLFRDSQEILK